MATTEVCPFCDIKVSSVWFGKHLFRHHLSNLFINNYGGGNLARLPKSKDKPFTLYLGSGNKLTPYFCCLSCQHVVKRQPFVARHFPTCKAEHNKLCDEYFRQFSSEEAVEESKPIVATVEGYTQDQVFALIGSLFHTLHNTERELHDYRQKYEYLEEKIKDVCSEEAQVEIEDSLPEYPEDDEVELSQPEDIAPLFNISSKIGISIRNKAVLDAYETWSKVPLKKKVAK